ncbi:MAG: hypothetical protein AAF738_09440 [Bacteroidota bacterium]
MKNYIARLLFALIIIGTIACETEEDTPSPETETKVEELVFGIYYGRCRGDCTHLFKINAAGLFPDTISGRLENGKWDNFDNTTPLSTEDYALASVLSSSVPEVLLNSPAGKFGNPNAADQGTLFVVAVQGGNQLGPWKIDPFETALNEDILPFQRELLRVINALRN